MKNHLPQTSSSWNIKLHHIVRVYDHASASNFFIIFVLLVCMYDEDRALSDDNCCIESIWTTDNTYRLLIIGIRDLLVCIYSHCKCILLGNPM